VTRRSGRIHRGDGPRAVTASALLTVTVTRATCVRMIVVGEIDHSTIPVLDRALDGQPIGTWKTLVVDLSRVSFCSIGGAQWLADLIQRAGGLGVPASMVVTRPVSRVLSFLPQADLIATHTDLASALHAVGHWRY